MGGVGGVFLEKPPTWGGGKIKAKNDAQVSEGRKKKSRIGSFGGNFPGRGFVCEGGRSGA